MFSDTGSTPVISTTSEQSAFDSVFALWQKHPSTPLLFLLPKKPKAFRGPRKFCMKKAMIFILKLCKYFIPGLTFIFIYKKRIGLIVFLACIFASTLTYVLYKTNIKKVIITSVVTCMYYMVLFVTELNRNEQDK